MPRMNRTRLLSLALLLVVGLTGVSVARGSDHDDRHVKGHSADPLVIAHRGASGYRPEHTLAAYELGARLGADYVEPDLVRTKDGVLVARHENEISGTTDVASHPEFAGRRTTKVIDGLSLTGWFTEDFTLAELKTLRAKERIPALRPRNTRFDGLYEVPTFQEVIDLTKRLSRELGRPIGIYPETKHPTYFRKIGLSLEEPLVRALNRNGLNSRHAKVFVQSFEVGNLKALDRELRVPLVQLLGARVPTPQKPWDFVVSGDPRTYVDMATPAGLREIARYADGVGPSKDYIVPRDAAGNSLSPTSFVDDAHDAGLLVHPYTFRNENTFLPLELRSSADPAAYGNAAAEYEQFFELGVDGLFSDNADTAVRARGGGKPGDGEARLLARAILPSDAYQPGPPSGTLVNPDNGVTPPFPGQPIPGFSAVLDGPAGTYWGMPDNGYGAKTNSADFLLRLYRIRPHFKTAQGGSGGVDVLDFVQLRDPGNKVNFPLTRPDRLLTGADFDLESVRRTADGDLWFGEEFGPFLLHTDARGRVLEAPIPLPDVQSPQNPFLPGPDAWNIPASRGFEPMALSTDGRRLYPMLEGALRSDPDPRRRVVNEFSVRAGEYTDRKWNYRVDAEFPNAVIGDMTAVDRNRFVLIERDDFQGVEAQQKKIYLVDLRKVDSEGYLKKELVLDLLAIRDPNGVSLPARPGEFGVGDPFSFPLQSVESLEVLDDEDSHRSHPAEPGARARLLIANDNNYPGSDGRWIARDRPDDVELIVVKLGGGL
jgi:glycerophosphoryl diester phosphodiesterase